MDSVSWLKGWKSFDWTNLDTVFEGLSSFWKKTVFVFKSKFLSRLQLWCIYGILLKKKNTEQTVLLLWTQMCHILLHQSDFLCFSSLLSLADGQTFLFLFFSNFSDKDIDTEPRPIVEFCDNKVNTHSLDSRKLSWITDMCFTRVFGASGRKSISDETPSISLPCKC